MLRGHHGWKVALKNELAALVSGLGPYFYEGVGCPHEGFVVLDNDDGIALLGQFLEDGDEAVDVARVEADGGFVEYKEGIDEGGSEAGGEFDALGFAA